MSPAGIILLLSPMVTGEQIEGGDICMSTVYVGLDLGSSNFHQVAVNDAGVSQINREFTTGEANLRKAFSDLHGQIQVHLEAGELAPGPLR